MTFNRGQRAPLHLISKCTRKISWQKIKYQEKGKNNIINKIKEDEEKRWETDRFFSSLTQV